jgi:nucleotide-binding universal stress UspA family protein
MQRILIAYDGSDASQRALERVTRFLLHEGARVGGGRSQPREGSPSLDSADQRAATGGTGQLRDSDLDLRTLA